MIAILYFPLESVSRSEIAKVYIFSIGIEIVECCFPKPLFVFQTALYGTAFL